MKIQVATISEGPSGANIELHKINCSKKNYEEGNHYVMAVAKTDAKVKVFFDEKDPAGKLVFGGIDLAQKTIATPAVQKALIRYDGMYWHDADLRDLGLQALNVLRAAGIKLPAELEKIS